ncbi:hypothetical protein FQZ97_758490 [compost metagenome]
MDDARERGVGRHGRHAKHQRAGLVDGAGKHRIARGLVDRDALARDRRLVDGAGAFEHHAVQRHALAGADAGHGIERHRVGAHGLPAAVGLPHLGLFGRQREQALDGVARAVDGAGLDELGDGVQRHHHRGLGPLADDEGARDGDGHQRIDVEAPAHQRGEALLVGVQAGQRDGREREPHLGGHEADAVECQEGHGLGRDGQHQRGHEARQAGRHAGEARGLGLLPRRRRHRLGLEAGLADGVERGGQCAFFGGEGQRAFAQAKAQGLHARDGLEGAADLGLFHRAVHGGNAKQDRALRQVGRLGRCRGAAAYGAAAAGRCRRGGGVIVRMVVPVVMSMAVSVVMVVVMRRCTRHRLIQGVLIRHAFIGNPEAGVESTVDCHFLEMPHHENR